MEESGCTTSAQMGEAATLSEESVVAGTAETAESVPVDRGQHTVVDEPSLTSLTVTEVNERDFSSYGNIPKLGVALVWGWTCLE